MHFVPMSTVLLRGEGGGFPFFRLGAGFVEGCVRSRARFVIFGQGFQTPKFNVESWVVRPCWLPPGKPSASTLAWAAGGLRTPTPVVRFADGCLFPEESEKHILFKAISRPPKSSGTGRSFGIGSRVARTSHHTFNTARNIPVD